MFTDNRVILLIWCCQWWLHWQKWNCARKFIWKKEVHYFVSWLS